MFFPYVNIPLLFSVSSDLYFSDQTGASIKDLPSPSMSKDREKS